MMQEVNLLDIIQDYQQTADRAVKVFQAKYQITDILEGWYSRLYDQTGSIEEYGVEFYAFHGIGLAIHFKDQFIDFDLALFPEPRHDGFDIWRLWGFIEKQPTKYSKYLDKNVLEKEFKTLIDQGIIVRPQTMDGTYLYFFTSSL